MSVSSIFKVLLHVNFVSEINVSVDYELITRNKLIIKMDFIC